MADTRAVTVVVTQRVNDFHASVPGESGMWGAGGSAAEALGQLVFAHPERFAVTIDSSGIIPLSRLRIPA
jgi:predicted RNase H-like HicB family nuclease